MDPCSCVGLNVAVLVGGFVVITAMVCATVTYFNILSCRPRK